MRSLVGSDVWSETDKETPKARGHGVLRWNGRNCGCIFTLRHTLFVHQTFEYIQVIFHKVGITECSPTGLLCVQLAPWLLFLILKELCLI